MEEKIIKEIAKKYNIKIRLVEELLKICINYGDTIEQANEDIINYILDKY